MASKNSKKTIEIVAAVQALLAELDIAQALESSAGQEGQEGQGQEGQGQAEYEDNAVVTRISDRRNNSVGTDPRCWEFLCHFKGGTSEWVLDSNMRCEALVKPLVEDLRTAFCFCRVSTKNQTGDTHVSLEAQEDALYEKARACGFTRIKVYKISASAYKNLPTALVGIGEGCKSADSIFIYRVDRLSRNIIKALAWLEEMNDKGVSIIAVDLDLMYGRDKLKFIEAVLDAQKESALLGSRIRMSIQRRRDRGDESVGSLPYGKKFQRNSDGALSVVDNLPEQFIIQRIIRQRGTKVSQIADGLNRAGLVKKNKRWTGAMVSRILSTH